MWTFNGTINILSVNGAPETPGQTMRFEERPGVDGEDAILLGLRGQEKPLQLFHPCADAASREVLYVSLKALEGYVITIEKSCGTVFTKQRVVLVTRGPDKNTLAATDGNKYVLQCSMTVKGVV